jgi:sugar O-acyltransferase (sialic acid O-acetyltransferase NeuD family)
VSAEGKSLVVIGAGGHATVVLSTVLDAGFCVAALLDDDPAKHGATVLGLTVADARRWTPDRGALAVIAVGDNRARQALAERFGHVRWARAVHPTAYIHPSVVISPGTVVFAGAVVQPRATLGAHCIVNTGVTVDHDCAIGDFAHLAPGVHLAGGVRVGQGTLLGVGCCAVPGVSIGSWVTLGAGAVVVRDLDDGVTAVGLPARPLSSTR